MSERSQYSVRALHAMKRASGHFAFACDKEEAAAIIRQWERLMDAVASRPARAKEPPKHESYSRRDKIREELANDPHCYD